MLVITTQKVKQAFEDFEKIKPRSAWQKGVIDYVYDFLDFINESLYWQKTDRMEITPTEKQGQKFFEFLRNGADSWSQYSWGGCSLIYDSDIAKRVCTPSALKLKKGGELQPSRTEQWLDIQAKALRDASQKLYWYAVRKWEE